MTLFKCSSCNGVYDDEQRDGERYYHACAPILNPGYNVDPGKGPVDTRETIERPGGRDENMVLDYMRPKERRPIVIGAHARSDGAGRVDVTPATR